VEPTPTPTDEQDNAALNVRKVDEEGNRLEGAIFTVEGMEGTFTTNARGFFCITGLENDSEWLVTEIEAPEGYEIAEEPSQIVEVDDDGDCDSPDAVFVNTLADEEPTATPTPTPTGEVQPTATPTPTPTGEVQPNQPTPTATPREDTAGGNPTPSPRAGNLPDTALDASASAIPSAVFALVAIASLGVLVHLQIAGARSRR
jgi:hypothetical protein